MTTTLVKEQIGLEDVIIKDDELEQLLEERQSLKESVSAYRKADKEAKNKIASLDISMPFRVSRFLISQKTIPGRSVEFEVQPSTRISIKTVDE